jgi:hypothetical protein
MVGKNIRKYIQYFFTWCCFPYVYFCELSLSWVYCFHLCVFVVSYVYLFHPMCICCTYVYLFYNMCIAALTLDVGLLARSQYPEGPATGHLDTGFPWFPCVYKRMLRWFPRFQVATTCLSCSPPDLNFLVTFYSYLCKCKINTASGWQPNCSYKYYYHY